MKDLGLQPAVSDKYTLWSRCFVERSVYWLYNSSTRGLHDDKDTSLEQNCDNRSGAKKTHEHKLFGCATSVVCPCIKFIGFLLVAVMHAHIAQGAHDYVRDAFK